MTAHRTGLTGRVASGPPVRARECRMWRPAAPMSLRLGSTRPVEDDARGHLVIARHEKTCQRNGQARHGRMESSDTATNTAFGPEAAGRGVAGIKAVFTLALYSGQVFTLPLGAQSGIRAGERQSTDDTPYERIVVDDDTDERHSPARVLLVSGGRNRSHHHQAGERAAR